MLKLIEVTETNEDFVSPAVHTVCYKRLAFQVIASTTEIFSPFTMKIQASLDDVNYVDVTGSSEVFAGAKSHIIEIPEPCASRYRIAIVFDAQVVGESCDIEVLAEFGGC